MADSYEAGAAAAKNRLLSEFAMGDDAGIPAALLAEVLGKCTDMPPEAIQMYIESFEPGAVDKTTSINMAAFLDYLFSAEDRFERERQALGVSPAEFEAHVRTLKATFAFQGYIERTELRGITLMQLRGVLAFAQKHCHTWRETAASSEAHGQNLSIEVLNLYHLNAWCILPATKESDCAFVELLTSKPQTPQWFCSHWWGEPLGDFVKCIERHHEVRGLPDSAAYWVHAYAGRQHSLQDDLVADPKQASFYKALQLSEGFLLVLDSKSTPSARLWCAFEEYTALCGDQGRERPLLLDVATCPPGGPTYRGSAQLITAGLTAEEVAIDREIPGFGRKVAEVRQLCFPVTTMKLCFAVDLQAAVASTDAVRRRILNCIAGRPSGELDAEPVAGHPEFDKANRRLRAELALVAWPQAAAAGAIGALGLPSILQADVGRPLLRFDLRNLEEKRAMAAFTAAAESLPPGLRRLEVLCDGLRSVTDEWLAELAACVPAALQQLHLDLAECDKVGDEGLTALARGLPPGLTQLHLNCFACKGVHDKGLAALAGGLPQELQQLELCFSWRNDKKSLRTKACHNIHDEGLAALAAGLPCGMCRLHLDFALCESIGDEGLAAFAAGLPPALQQLRLNFSGCVRLRDEGLAALAAGLPQGLQQLHLDFAICQCVGDEGLAALAAGLPASLQQLHLGFESCRKVSDAGLAALGRSLPAGLQGLHIGLVRTSCSEAGSQAAAAGAAALAAWQVASSLPAVRPAEPAPPAQAIDEAAVWDGMLAEAAEALASNPPSAMPTPRAGSKASMIQTPRTCSKTGIPIPRISVKYEVSVPVSTAAMRLFARALASCDSDRIHEVSLSFRDSSIGDEGLAVLASGLPPTLQRLHLSFALCSGLGYPGLAALAGSLPAELRRLHLNFQACGSIGDEGLPMLAKAFPSTLRELRLNFSSCNVSDEARAALKACLPESIEYSPSAMPWGWVASAASA